MCVVPTLDDFSQGWIKQLTTVPGTGVVQKSTRISSSIRPALNSTTVENSR